MAERSAAGATGVEAFAVGGEEPLRERLAAGGVAGGDGEAADEVGVDAFARLGASLGGAEQVAEPEGGVAAAFFARLHAESGCSLEHRFADPGEVARLLVLGEAVADRR